MVTSLYRAYAYLLQAFTGNGDIPVASIHLPITGLHRQWGHPCSEHTPTYYRPSPAMGTSLYRAYPYLLQAFTDNGDIPVGTIRLPITGLHRQ